MIVADSGLVQQFKVVNLAGDQIDRIRLGDSNLLVLTDDGIGIAEAEQDRLFDSFFRASATAQSTPGTGLGLAICKAIVELHGGTIRVESSVGDGAGFEFVIPDRPESTP